MKIPGMFKSLIVNAIVDAGLKAYADGRDHHISGEYDEKKYKKLLKDFVQNNNKW